MIVRFGVRTGLVEQDIRVASHNWWCSRNHCLRLRADKNCCAALTGCGPRWTRRRRLTRSRGHLSRPRVYLHTTLGKRGSAKNGANGVRRSQNCVVCCTSCAREPLLRSGCCLRRIRLDRGHASLRAACFSAFHHCWTRCVDLATQWRPPFSSVFIGSVSFHRARCTSPAPQFVCATRVSGPSSVLPQPDLDLPPSLARVLISNTACSELDSCAHFTLVS